MEPFVQAFQKKKEIGKEVEEEVAEGVSESRYEIQAFCSSSARIWGLNSLKRVFFERIHLVEPLIML
jgi:predicted GNAT family acetyltransferase